MFLFLAKTLDWLLSPLSWTILLMIAALHWRKRSRLAVSFTAAALGILFIFSSQTVSNRLAWYTESSMAATFRPQVHYDAVIVLGGGLDPEATLIAGKPEYNGGAERILRGYEFLRSGQATNVLLSAGTLDVRPHAPVEANILSQQLQSWGVERERIFAEGKSRNTRENAVESEKIIRAQQWKTLLLVTSAAHMPRAYGCFRAVGLNPDVLPVDFRGAKSSLSIADLAPRASNMETSAAALRELAGRVVYRTMGYSRI